MRFIAILMGGLFLTTAVMAVEAKEKLSPPVKTQEMSSHKKVQHLKKSNIENNIFDDYSSGKSTFKE